MAGEVVGDYEKMKDKVDLYKSHYENLFYLLLSVLAAFITLGLYILGDLSALFERSTMQLMKQFFTAVPTIVIIFLAFILGCWLFQIILRTFGELFDVVYEPVLKKSRGDKVVSRDIIKSVFSLLCLLLIALIVYLVVKNPILNDLFRLYVFLGISYMFVHNLNWDHEKEVLGKEILAIIAIFGSYAIIFQRYMLFIVIIFVHAVLVTRILDIYHKMININEAMEIIYRNEKRSKEYRGDIEKVTKDLREKIDKARRKSLIPLIRIEDILRKKKEKR